MKAMIFAAGLGTRLRPYTDDRPKALVEVKGKPLLGHCLDYLYQYGIREVVVNIHHFADMMENYIATYREQSDMQIHISDERECLLDTGGGLWKAANYFTDSPLPFLVINVDILTNLDINAFMEAHKASGAMATLAVTQRETSRGWLFDKDMRLRGWKNQKTGQVRMAAEDQQNDLTFMAFSGVHIISPQIFESYHADGVWSINEAYLALAGTHDIRGYDHTGDKWMDMGTPESIRLGNL